MRSASLHKLRVLSPADSVATDPFRGSRTMLLTTTPANGAPDTTQVVPYLPDGGRMLLSASGDDAGRRALGMAPAGGGLRLAVHLEPCVMCLGAAMTMGVTEVFFGLESPGDGAARLASTWTPVSADMPWVRAPAMIGGVRRDDVRAQFRRYCQSARDSGFRRWRRLSPSFRTSDHGPTGRTDRLPGMAHVLSVNLAVPRPHPAKKTGVTGIDKQPAHGAVPVRAPGPKGSGLGSGLEVTSPRIPCGTFSAWIDEQRWTKRFTVRAAPGAYLRVIAPGTVSAGDSVTVVSRPGHDVTVGMTFRALTREPDLLPRLRAADALHREARDMVVRRTAGDVTAGRTT